MDNYLEKSPNYIFEVQQLEYSYEGDKSKGIKIYKIAIRSLAVFFLLCSIIFDPNFYFSLPLYPKVIFPILFISTFMLNSKKKSVPTTLLISFFDDYMTFYCNKRRCSYNLTRMDWIKIYYKDVKNFTCNKNRDQLVFNAKMQVIYNKYDKNGVLNKEPYKNHIVDSYYFIYTKFDSIDKIIYEIESHTPLKFTSI